MLVMNGIQVDCTHLMHHFMQHGPDTAGPGLQTRHGVMGDFQAIRELQGFFKMREMTPNALFCGWVFFLAFGRMQNQKSVNCSVIIQIILGPIDITSYR